MELKYSPLSPFVRKVTVVAHELGIAERIRLTKVDARNDPGSLVPFNPLGKIPALVTDDGTVIFDSPVICEYLDAEFGGHRLLPASGPKRWAVLTRMALADGIMEAAVLVRNERARPEPKQSADWIAWQLKKVYGGLDHLETQVDSFGDTLDLGLISVACALGYMPLRIEELVGLPRWPKLRAWGERVSQREAFKRTAPVL